MRTQLILLAAALNCSLFAMPAQAARDRVFVASYGTDTNNTTCSFTQPCRTFQNAVTNVAPGGEVTAIDNAGFGPVNITQAVTITSPDGVEAGIVPSAGTDAVIINTSGDVFLRGLTIEGNEASPNGISISNTATSPTTLGIVHCTIRHFTNDGIYLQPTGTLRFSIANTVADNNGHDGIELAPSGTGASLVGVIEHSATSSNVNNGIGVSGANAIGSEVLVLVANSVSSNNGNDGINVATSPAGETTYVTVRDTTASGNGNSGFDSNAGGCLNCAHMVLAHSLATHNNKGIVSTGGAFVGSFGDNHVYDNFQGDISGTVGPISLH